MHPVIFAINQFEVFGRTIGPMYIFSYGVFLAIAFIAGMLLLIRDGKRIGIRTEDVMDAMIYIIVMSIIGARLLYIFLQPGEYAADPLGSLKIYEGGLSFHGGAIGGILAILIFTWRRRMKFWFFADACVRPLVLGSAITRFGCFFNGCCFGHGTDVPWAIVFPVLHDDLPRHPTQLYDMILHVLLFIVISYAVRWKRKHGDISAFYLMGFAVLRFIVEIFRVGATARELLGALSEAQVASFGIFAIGLGLYLYRGRDMNKQAVSGATGKTAPATGGKSDSRKQQSKKQSKKSKKKK